MCGGRTHLRISEGGIYITYKDWGVHGCVDVGVFICTSFGAELPTQKMLCEKRSC